MSAGIPKKQSGVFCAHGAGLAAGIYLLPADAAAADTLCSPAACLSMRLSQLHAESTTYIQRRITFSRAGVAATITLASTHLMLRLTSAAAVNNTAASMTDCKCQNV